ncbi:MAG: hypothetical protein ACKOPG_05815 [Novosphingobium sp.]
MKRFTAFALAFAAFAAPALAEETKVPAENDLVCVAWSGFFANRAATEEDKRGLTMLLFYYIGRWETATGQGIDSALTPEWAGANSARILAAGPDCEARGRAVAGRVSAAGERLKTSGKK